MFVALIRGFGLGTLYLNDGGEYEGEREEDEEVERRRVRDLGQVGPGLQPEERHRQDGGDAFGKIVLV